MPITVRKGFKAEDVQTYAEAFRRMYIIRRFAIGHKYLRNRRLKCDTNAWIVFW